MQLIGYYVIVIHIYTHKYVHISIFIYIVTNSGKTSIFTNIYHFFIVKIFKNLL